MAEYTFTQVQARIVALCPLISGVQTAIKDYPSEPFPAANLPVMAVRPGRVTYSDASATSFYADTEYALLLHISRAGDEQVPDATQEAACYPYLVSVARYFKGNKRLAGKTLVTDAQDNGYVYSSTFRNANGAHRNIAYYGNGESEVFWGPVFMLIVRTLHRI